MKTVVVIGAGASGTLLCAQLPASTRIEWVGDEKRFGPGLAFGTLDSEHLLNVPARGMSAFPDRPLHFFEWLQAKHPELHARETDFIPRLYYGEYLEQLVPAGRPNLTRHADEALEVERVADGFVVRLKSGKTLRGDAVVVAIGNLSGEKDSGARLLRELKEVRSEEKILILGTGLTMIDAILSLRARGHRGAITARSRRGLFPRSHDLSCAPHVASAELKKLLVSSDLRLSRAIRTLRNECRLAESQGSGWRAVFDLLRPDTPALWQKLTLRDRHRFIRHVRAYWDVHRHRAAPEVHRAISELQENGLLKIERGRAGQRTAQNSAQKTTETFDRVIDCTGLIPDLHRARSPLLRSLLDRGLVRIDDPAIGIHSEAPGLYVVGPLLRAQLWESIAVPEIRLQAHDIVKKLG